MSRYLNSKTVGSALLWAAACFVTGIIVLLAIARCREPLWGFWGIQSGGDQLVFAVHIARGISYFSKGDGYPMLFPQTPGLFPLLISPFVRLFGPKLLYGNILGALSLMTTLGAVAWAAISATRSKTAAALGWLVLLTMPRLADGYTWNRPDSLCAALVAVTIALLVKSQIAPAGRQRRWILLSGVTTCFALFSKQLALPLGLAILFFFLVRRNSTNLIYYVSGLLAPSVLMLAVGEYFSHGAFLYDVLTMTHGMTTFSAHQWASNAGLFAVASIVWLVVALWDSARAMNQSVGPDDHAARVLPMLRTTTVVMLVFAFATCWHIGGSLNYFLNANVALAVLCAVVVPCSPVLKVPFCPHWSLVAALLVVALTGLQQLSPWRTVRENWINMAKENPHLPLTRAVYSATANLRGEVFFDRTTGLAALQGRDVEVETSALCYYRRRGLWHPDVLANDLRRGRWDYVLVLHPNAATPVAFGNDRMLDAAFRSGYQCGLRFPLDSVGTLFTDPEVQLCQPLRKN